MQGELEQALTTVLRLPEPAQLTVAGRTDAGVHARGQVAHLDVPTPLLRRSCSCASRHAVQATHDCMITLVRRLNGLLAADVRVVSVAEAPAGFDARFSALSRRYAYRVTDTVGDPLRRYDTLTYPRPLDIGAMNAAAARLVGEHDFAAFCRRREGATTVRGLLVLHWVRDAAGVAVATVEADAFCHNMVRALVGALLAVGDGRRGVDWPAQVLAGGVRDPGVAVLPPHGLTLEEVRYPDDAELARRAHQTRAVRVPSGPPPAASSVITKDRRGPGPGDLS